MLPRAAYLDPAVFAWEQRYFFGAGWTCVGHSSQVALPGDQRAEQAGAGSVLLVRGDDGFLRAFANTCRHRGHELLACGSTEQRNAIICPYHSWTYSLSGGLQAAAGFKGRPGFDAAAWGLIELPVEEWHGLIFVDGSGTAAPLADCLRTLDELVAPYEPERLVISGRHDYDSTDGAWVGGWMELRDSMDTMSLDGSSLGVPLRGLDERALRSVIYVNVFPNVLLSLHPDYVMTHRLVPLAADRTKIECTWAFAPEALERPGFDPGYAVEFWDITNRQDWGACESVQRGLSSEHAQPGPLSAEEDAVHKFVTVIARGYQGEPAWNPAANSAAAC